MPFIKSNNTLKRTSSTLATQSKVRKIIKSSKNEEIVSTDEEDYDQDIESKSIDLKKINELLPYYSNGNQAVVVSNKTYDLNIEKVDDKSIKISYDNGSNQRPIINKLPASSVTNVEINSNMILGDEFVSSIKEVNTKLYPYQNFFKTSS